MARLSRFLLAAVALAACDRGLDTIGSWQPRSVSDPGISRNGELVPKGRGGSGGSVNVHVLAGQGGVSDGVVNELPDDFVATDIGGYQLGEPIGEGGAGGTFASGEDAETNDCGNILLGVVRDFRGAEETEGHPDFEARWGIEPTLNLVAGQLGADRKPVYTQACESGQPLVKALCPYDGQTTSRERFDQWYRNTEGVNSPYLLRFYFVPDGGHMFSFRSTAFFPIDNAGFGNPPDRSHNYSFTTELHTRFQYSGGEIFQFVGDDDVWVFFDGTLVVDLGGLHSRQDRTVELDAVAAELGFEVGGIYDLDLFHAERHAFDSNFGITTNLAFVNCGFIEPGVVK